MCNALKTSLRFAVQKEGQSIQNRHKIAFSHDMYYDPPQKKKTKLSGFNMFAPISAVWDFVLGPILQRPKRLQMAALCHREKGAGREYLLVTSRDTGRWIIPKGWPIRGLKADETALQEAWEEAGVRGTKDTSDPVGTYTYDKKLANGVVVPVETLVYSIAVKDVQDSFPEASERKRRWVPAEEAANLVQEDELKNLFLTQQTKRAS